MGQLTAQPTLNLSNETGAVAGTVTATITTPMGTLVLTVDFIKIGPAASMTLAFRAAAEENASGGNLGAGASGNVVATVLDSAGNPVDEDCVAFTSGDATILVVDTSVR